MLSYNYYGELARVDLPTGGRIEYDYDVGVTGTGDSSGVINGGPDLSKHIYRRVVQRRVYSDAGTTLQVTETYSQPEDLNTGNAGYVLVKHEDSGNSVLAREIHYYVGSPKASFFRFPYEYAKWQDGKETRTEYYNKGNSGALLRTVDNTWQQPLAGGTWPFSGSGETNASAKPNSPQVTATVTTLNDTSQVSKQTYSYDQYLNKTEVDEYDLGSLSTPVRKTITSFLANANYTTVSVSNPDPSSIVHIRSLPVDEAVYDSSSTRKAHTTYEYDVYTANLAARSNIVGHDTTTSGAPQPIHEHVLPDARECDASHPLVLGSPDVGLSTRMQYDIAGNAVSATDPLSNTTQFDFADRFGIPDGEAESNTPPPGGELNGGVMTYAFATKTTNALNPPQLTYTQYDYHLGKPVNSEDANGIVTKGRYAGFEDGTYTDALDRPTELVVAVNGGLAARRTRFTYNEASKLITTQSDQTNLNDGALKTEALYDGLGRTIETHGYESASAYITTKQEFDGMGRVSRSYNPYRTTGDPTYGYATTTYDAWGEFSLLLHRPTTQ